MKTNFDDLMLSEFLIKTLNELKFLEATAIQQLAIPSILTGGDVVIQAQTGSGKTAAYVLPLLHQLNLQFDSSLRVLVLVPTRELAIQVCEVFRSLGRHLHPRQNVLPIVGGENIDQQINSLGLARQIIVATPGRLLELVKLKKISLHEVRFLVFDEADKILNLGFSAEINSILDLFSKGSKRQNIFVSATFPEKLKALIESVTHDFTHQKIESETHIPLEIEQRAIELTIENKGPLLRHLIISESWDHVLVFVESKKASQNVTKKLRQHGVDAEEFHGDLDQDQRNAVLTKFKNKKIRVLVATDLVCRGIDILNLSHVVNYDLPRSPNDYLHRIGRSGRAGVKGQAISFITCENDAHFRLIEKKNKITVPREQVKGFEIKHSNEEAQEL